MAQTAARRYVQNQYRPPVSIGRRASLSPMGKLAGPECQWTPQPGPQTEAYNSEAKVIGFGGAQGGGKTDLLLGFAGTKHWRSIIFREVFPSVRGIIDRSREIYNSGGESAARDSFNESLHIWRLSSGRTVELGSMQREQDKEKHRGVARDFYGFDEATEFSESRVRFVIGWNRSTHIDPETNLPQRCRVVLTFNPPMNDKGQWVIKFFAPWLDREYPDPAKDGEIRWFGMAGDDEVEIPATALDWYIPVTGGYAVTDDGTPFKRDGRWVIPQRGTVYNDVVMLVESRTFFHASLKDNPILEASGYGATIEALPEPLRSFAKGNFDAARTQDPWQVIPALWVQLAQKRWRETPKPVDVPMTAAGLDVAHGGKDKTVLAPRYDLWWDELKTWKGVETPSGQAAANVAWPLIAPGAQVNVDAIGYGASCCERLEDLARAMAEAETPEGEERAIPPTITAINVGAASGYRDKSQKYGMKNLRAELHWRMRELLDPANGHDIALPPDQELLADLCAPRYSVEGVYIIIEKKKDIIERIGRSPDKGDAVLLSLMTGRRIMVSAV